jgi:hypothetical protein
MRIYQVNRPEQIFVDNSAKQHAQLMLISTVLKWESNPTSLQVEELRVCTARALDAPPGRVAQNPVIKRWLESRFASEPARRTVGGDCRPRPRPPEPAGSTVTVTAARPPGVTIRRPGAGAAACHCRRPFAAARELGCAEYPAVV